MINRLFIMGAILVVISCFQTIIHAARSDPFSQPASYASKRLAYPILKGIVRQGECSGALLTYGGETEIVVEGDIFASYRVKQVNQQQVVLLRGTQQIILTLEKK